jgi:hypothetical protein
VPSSARHTEATLVAYHFLQAARGQGLDEINRELAKRFEGQGRRTTPSQ